MSRLRILSGMLLLAVPAVAMAAGEQDQEALPFNVRAIPESLHTHADAIYRLNDVRFEVLSTSEARLDVEFAVTIYRNEGRDFGCLDLPYDTFHKIRDLDGWLYDADGKEVRTLESEDVRDESNISAASLYEDARSRSAQIFYDQYPYTVRYKYAMTYRGYLDWPDWEAQGSDEAVEKSRFEVVLPMDMPLRYWTNRDTLKPVITVDGEKRHYVWEARNLPDLSETDMAEELEQRTAKVIVAPDSFEIGGTGGRMSTWKSFGQWYTTLWTGRITLPEGAAKEVHSLVNGVTTTKEKVKILYKYLQDHTRYVNITLGIGGWQPFEAGYVYSRGYGDCKALSNYMVALLKEAGVPAYPALIAAGAGRPPIKQVFPSNQFNHVVVCVPEAKDSVWLECTSNTDRPGQMGAFTEDRDALLATPQGGVLVHTPATRAAENRQSRVARIVLAPTGTGDASVRTTTTGDQQEYLAGALTDRPPNEVRKWILNHLALSNVTLNQYEVSGLRASEGPVVLSLRLALPQLASISASRLFLSGNAFERRTTVPRDCPSRKTPVRLGYPYLDTDSITYVLPGGYATESLPKPVELNAPFGSFRAGIRVVGDSVLLYTRALEFPQRTIPAEQYQEYRKFMMDVVRADKMQAVLKRITP